MIFRKVLVFNVLLEYHNSMGDDNNTELLGKKIFFCHPSTVVRNGIIPELVQQEYEIYLIKEEPKLVKALRRYPDSIVFASIEETLQPKEWENLIRVIMGDGAIKGLMVGILVNTENSETKNLYLNTLKVQCGYMPVKSDPAKLLKLLLEILKTAEAKGRRKFIRVDTRDDPMVTINLSLDGKYHNGNIQDISVIGFSCVFAEDPGLEKNSLFSDIQVKLQSSILKVQGIVFGSRMDGAGKIYVIVFTQKTDPVVRSKIRTYIQHHLQTKLDNEIR